MTRIRINDLNSDKENDLMQDLPESKLETIVGGESYSYTLDLGGLRQQLNGISNEIGQLDGRTVTLSVTTSQGGSTGGTTTQAPPPKAPSQPPVGFYVMPVPQY